MIILRVRRRAATAFAPLLLPIFGSFVLSAAAETSNEQKARVERIENAVLAPCCYTESASRHAAGSRLVSPMLMPSLSSSP